MMKSFLCHSRKLFVSGIAFTVFGTGSTANGSMITAYDTAQRSSPRNTPTASSLPIPPGLFVADYSGSCSKATELLFYDGKSIGQILQALPGDRLNSPRAAAVETRSIRRTGVPARGSREFEPDLAGFTRIWFMDDQVGGGGIAVEARGIRATGSNNFVLREGSMSARRMEYDNTSYSRCAFAQLSPKMQDTVRRFQPSLAGIATQSVPGANSKSKTDGVVSSGRIPLEAGYYAYVEGKLSTCAKPLSPPWYYDGVRFREESDVTDPRHELTSQALKWEMAGPNRFRITYRSRDEDGNWDRQYSVNEYVITGPRSFTFVGAVGGPMRSNERYQLCPAAQLPPKARWYKGAR